MDAGSASAATVTPATTSARSRPREYPAIDLANGTNRVVIGGRLADANAPRPLYALLNGCTCTPDRRRWRPSSPDEDESPGARGVGAGKPRWVGPVGGAGVTAGPAMIRA